MLSGFLLAILSYFIMQARLGLDCNLLLNMSVISFWMLLKAKNTGKKIFYIIAGILYGISYYTYALGYITITIFLLGVLIYWLYFKQIKLGECILLLAPVTVIASPLLLMVLINQFDFPQLEILNITITRLPEYRASTLNFENIWNNLVETVKVILTRDPLDYNALDKYYTMYKISIPFAVIGFIVLLRRSFCAIIKKYYFEKILFLFWVLVYIFLGSLIGHDGTDAPNINRLNGIFFGVLFCVIYCMRFVYILFKKWLYNGKKVIDGSVKESLLLLPRCTEKIACLVLLIYFFCYLGFAWHYFSEVSRNAMFRGIYSEILQAVREETGTEKTIYIQGPYIYYLLSEKVNPYSVRLVEDKLDSYENAVFQLPVSLEEDAEESVYIVYKDYEEYIENLRENYNFNELEDEIYCCFYTK